MALEAFIDSAMTNLEVLISGAFAGFALGYLMMQRKMKRRRMGGMGY